MPAPVNLSCQHTTPCAYDLTFETDFWPHNASVRVLWYLNSTADDGGQTTPRLFYLQRDSNQNPLKRKLGGLQVWLRLLVYFIFVENELLKCWFFLSVIARQPPVEEWPACRRDLYPTTQHSRETSMPPTVLKPAILASERPQTHALDRAAFSVYEISYCRHSNSILHTAGYNHRSLVIKTNGKLSVKFYTHYANMLLIVTRPTTIIISGPVSQLNECRPLPSTRLLISMYERNTIKLHVQVFLRMNTWMFETCRKHYN